MTGKPWETGTTGDSLLHALASLLSQAQQLQVFTLASKRQHTVKLVQLLAQPRSILATTVGQYFTVGRCYARSQTQGWVLH